MKETSTNFNATYITWECTTECNYSCSYCWPACHDGKHRWPDINKTNKLISYIEKFRKDRPVVLNIIGGEPTLWPNLENFCFTVGKYSLITFISNGSRTAKWWKKFKAPINLLMFSFHPETANIENFIEMLKTVHDRYRIGVFILYHPKFKKKCLEIYNRLVLGDFNISCRMKRIVSHADYNIEYTAEDKKILLYEYNNCKISLKHPKMDFFVDNKKVNPVEIISADENSFKDWSCQLGSNYRYIKADGTIYGSACGVGSSVGNVYENNELQEPDKVICTLPFCTCRIDLILNKKIKL